MENKDITIERAHRTGSKTNGKKCYYCKSFELYGQRCCLEPIWTKTTLQGQYLGQ